MLSFPTTIHVTRSGATRKRHEIMTHRNDAGASLGNSNWQNSLPEARHTSTQVGLQLRNTFPLLSQVRTGKSSSYIGHPLRHPRFCMARASSPEDRVEGRRPELGTPGADEKARRIDMMPSFGKQSAKQVIRIVLIVLSRFDGMVWKRMEALCLLGLA